MLQEPAKQIQFIESRLAHDIYLQREVTLYQPSHKCIYVYPY